MISRYGDSKKIKDDDKNAIFSLSSKLAQQDRKKISDEFLKVLNYDDCDHRGTMKIYGDLGLLDGIFPQMNLDTEFPKELRELGDKHMPIAWILRNHVPEDIENSMQGFDPNIIKKILFLIKSLNIIENIDENKLADLRNNYYESGVTTRTLKNWTTKIANKDENLINAFIEHIKSPRIKVYISEDNNQIHQDFEDLKNPFTGVLDVKEIESRKKKLEHRNFIAILKKYKGD